MHPEAFLPAITATISVVASVGGLGWWLRGEFNAIREFMRAAIDVHEEKDQKRFAETHDAIRQIERRNDRVDGEYARLHEVRSAG